MSAIKIQNIMRAMSVAAEATDPKPNMAATTATIRKTSAHQSIVLPSA